MTKPDASHCTDPTGKPCAMRRRWPYPAAAASALLLAAASPAAASDIGSFLGAVGGMLSQGLQQPRYYQPQPQYYYQQPAPQYY